MAEATVRLARGQHWTAGQFVGHYFEPTASGTPTPIAQIVLLRLMWTGHGTWVMAREDTITPECFRPLVR
jgi:hypothetical protein